MSLADTSLVRYRGGLLVSGSGTVKGDLLVERGRLAAVVGWEESVAGVSREVILDGAFVLPGLVDAHVHFGLPVGAGRSSEGVEEGTSRCLAGGVTTVADFAAPPERGETLAGCLTRRRAEFEGRSGADYLFHFTLPGSGAWDQEMATLANEDSHRFKVFTTYKQRGLMSSLRDIEAALAAVAGTDSSVWAHCESDELVENATTRCKAEKRLGAAALPDMRPPEAEVEAISALLELQRRHGAALHVVHISTRSGADLIQAARKLGEPVTGETCPHYLVWDRTQNQAADGYRWTMAPPLRTPDDVTGLWQALQRGALQMVTTDTCGFPDQWKLAGTADLSGVPMGINSAGMILPVLWTLGVQQGRLAVERLVELTAEGPARGLGIYPRKGTLRSGADADFVVMPSASQTPVTPETVCPLYNTRPWSGWPLMVVKGGVCVRADGKVAGVGCGRYLGSENQE